MDIILFAILLITVLLLTLIGSIAMRNKGLIIICGFSLMLLGVFLLVGNVTHKTGEVISETQTITGNTTSINSTMAYVETNINDANPLYSNAFGMLIICIGLAITLVSFMQSRF